jgi:hypothetical protein
VSDKPVLHVVEKMDESGMVTRSRPASPAELVAAVKQFDGVEELMEVTSKGGVVLADGAYLEPGTYLVVPVSASEEPTQ